MSKKSSELWKNLSVKERAHWDEVATRDKQRFMAEKAIYTGPWQVPWKRAKKVSVLTFYTLRNPLITNSQITIPYYIIFNVQDPSAPKRPMSAFLYFSQDKRRALKKDNPGMRNTEISRILGELWRKATEDERKPHVDREARERKRYKVVIAQWRKEDKIRKEEQKRAQAEHAKMVAQQQSMYPATTRADGSNGSYGHDGQYYGYYDQHQQTRPQGPYNNHFPGLYSEPQDMQRQVERTPIYPVDHYNQVSQTVAAPTDFFPQQYVPAPPPNPHAGYHLNSSVPISYHHPNSTQQGDYDIDPAPYNPFEPEHVHFASN